MLRISHSRLTVSWASVASLPDHCHQTSCIRKGLRGDFHVRKLAFTYLGHSTPYGFLFDTKELYHFLSSQFNSVGQSVCSGVSSIRFYNESALHVFRWIFESCDPADIGSTQNRSLVFAFALKGSSRIFSLRLHFDGVRPSQSSP